MKSMDVNERGDTKHELREADILEFFEKLDLATEEQRQIFNASQDNWDVISSPVSDPETPHCVRFGGSAESLHA